jgi:large subunit ribosomal protein L15
MLKLHELRPAPGSHKRKKRVGRGTAGKGGKTAGRGTKGQKARDQVPAGFEGGQIPLLQRIPKLKGFRNPFKVAYSPVNLRDLGRLEVAEIGPEILEERGLVKRGHLVKVLGDGRLEKPVTVRAHAFSVSARSAIEAAGGRAIQLEAPFKVRPPFRGSATSAR